MRRVVMPLFAVALTLGVLAGCSDDAPESEAVAPDTTAGSGGTEPPATDGSAEPDGVLSIGVLLPRSGDGGAIGIPGIAAADRAVAEINGTGGVLDEPVELVTNVDEGETLEQAQVAIDELLAAGVDAIVGPASSVVALQYLDVIVGAGVVTCSPTATSLALDDFPDRGLFFRSVPSDSLAAVAMAGQAERTGVNSATVVYVDDYFGRPFARAVMDNLRNRGIEVLNDIPIENQPDDFAEAVDEIASADATGTIILVASSGDGWDLLTRLAEVLPAGPPRIIVNDALRRPPAPEIAAALPEAFRRAIQGMSPTAILDPPAPEGAYAPEAYNCVNLIALATAAAGSDDPTALAEALPEVAEVGSDCESFSVCVERLRAGLDIDYNGPASLLLELGPNGDPRRAVFEVFEFDANGLDVGVGGGTVSY